jgi:hypothetical protein
MAMTGKNRIVIYGPKTDGTYIVEFRTADGEALAISVPAGELLTSIFPARLTCRKFGHAYRSALQATFGW